MVVAPGWLQLLQLGSGSVGTGAEATSAAGPAPINVAYRFHVARKHACLIVSLVVHVFMTFPLPEHTRDKDMSAWFGFTGCS